MSSSTSKTQVRIDAVRFTKGSLVVDLEDGRSVSVPLAWYPPLLHAGEAERADWQISAGGYGVHWPALDEDLSSEGILSGAPSPRRSVPARS